MGGEEDNNRGGGTYTYIARTSANKLDTIEMISSESL